MVWPSWYQGCELSSESVLLRRHKQLVEYRVENCVFKEYVFQNSGKSRVEDF